MSRYFFDVTNSTAIRDETGMNLGDLAQARHEALRRAADYASDPNNLDAEGVVVVSVRDETGAPVMTVRLVCQVVMAEHDLDGFSSKAVETDGSQPPRH